MIRYSCEKAYEKLLEEVSGFLGDSWTFVKSNNAFKKKDGGFVFNIFIWRSHHNVSYEYIVFDSYVAVDYKKERVMLYQFEETYHLETENQFNGSITSFEDILETEVFPVINELNSNNEAVLKSMTSKDNFWKYHVNPQYLIDRLGKDALTGLAKEIMDSMSDGDKERVKAYLGGDTTALGERSAYIAFCKGGLFDEIQ